MDATMTTLARQLGDRIRGRVILPVDPDYDEARAIWNIVRDADLAIRTTSSG